VLNAAIDHGQIINETNIDKGILLDLDLNGLKHGMTPVQVNNILLKYGLYLEKDIRNVPVFVVSENN